MKSETSILSQQAHQNFPQEDVLITFMHETAPHIEPLHIPQMKKNSHQAHNNSLNKRKEESPLTTRELYKKHGHFTDLIDFDISPSRYSRDGSSITVDRYLPEQYRFLKRLECVSVKNRLPISEYIVTGYHQSGLTINQYIAQNQLFNELSAENEISAEIMNRYLIEYERAVAKPLPCDVDQRLNIRRFTDSVAIIKNYMIEINNGISSILSHNASYPVQIDTFFVAPETHNNVDLSSLNRLTGAIKSDASTRRNGAIDGVSDVYHLLRRAAPQINNEFGQRFIMLIIRENQDDSADDTIYFFKPNTKNSVPDASVISDYVELMYLLNSKSLIAPGLSSTDEGVLGFTHHLHSHECNKVYLSYGDYKSRVFKHDILHKLQLLFNHHNDRRHYIGQNAKIDFMDSYVEFRDDRYNKFGEYWFNNNKQYRCFEPYWHPQNCRAMGNVFIPKQEPSCTQQLKHYIDETFESAEKLYYKMDYNVGMQIIDKQTIYIQFPEADDDTHDESGENGICLMGTELHKNGEPLYAVIVRNNYKHKSKQRWKIVEYTDISEAFMTKEQLKSKYGIFSADLPQGSKAKHNSFQYLQSRIEVSKELIRKTNWSHIRIVQTKQNKDSNKKCKKVHNKDIKNGVAIGTLEISEKRFKRLAIKSFIKHKEQRKPLTPIAHFKFRKNKYHLEKLLPVFIPEYEKYVAISFWYNPMAEKEKGRTQASRVCLDLTDMKNKANLIEMVPSDSWLNKATEAMTINNLTIGEAKKSKSKCIKNKHKTPRMNATKSKSIPIAAKSSERKTASCMPYVASKVAQTFTRKAAQSRASSQPQMTQMQASYNVQTSYTVQIPHTQTNVQHNIQPQAAPVTTPPSYQIQQILQSHAQYAQLLPNPSNFVNISYIPQAQQTYYSTSSSYSAYNVQSTANNTMMYNISYNPM